VGPTGPPRPPPTRQSRLLRAVSASRPRISELHSVAPAAMKIDCGSSLRSHLSSIQGKTPCFAPVFPLCLPAAAIHPFLPNSSHALCLLLRRGTKARQPLTIQHQSNIQTTTPIIRTLRSPTPSPPDGTSFLTPGNENGWPSKGRRPAAGWPHSLRPRRRSVLSYLPCVRCSLLRFRGGHGPLFPEKNEDCESRQIDLHVNVY